MRVTAMALAVAAALAGATASAQPVPGPAPAQPAPMQAQFDPQVVLWGYRSPRPQGVAKPMRSAVPDGDMVAWVPQDDPAVRGLVADPDARANASLRLEIDTGGRVTACTATPRHMQGALPTWLDGLCDRIAARARFIPAIDDRGTRVADSYQLTIGLGRFGRRSGEPVLPLVVEREPSPMPMMARETWPPRWVPASPAYAGLPLATGGAAAHAAESVPWAGIEVRQHADGRTTQRIVRSSEDNAFDTRALRVARDARPQWPAADQRARRWAMIHFVSVDGEPKAIVPVTTGPVYPVMADTARTALQQAIDWPGADDAAKARLRFALDIGADGQVTQCRIERSSGSDAGDVAGCRAMLTARFDPHRDIFGWPHPWFLHDWPLVAPQG